MRTWTIRCHHKQLNVLSHRVFPGVDKTREFSTPFATWTLRWRPRRAAKPEKGIVYDGCPGIVYRLLDALQKSLGRVRSTTHRGGARSPRRNGCCCCWVFFVEGVGANLGLFPDLPFAFFFCFSLPVSAQVASRLALVVRKTASVFLVSLAVSASRSANICSAFPTSAVAPL